MHINSLSLTNFRNYSEENISFTPGINLLTGANLLDVIFGTLATFLGAIGGRFLRKWDYLVPLPTILANTIIVPLVIVYGFGVTDMGLPLVALGVFSGEIISAGIIGTGLVSILKKYNIRF